MKYGIISDVHANIIALKIVLKKFEELNVDKIICCGDVIGIGPEPESVVQELIKLGDKLICVSGNHEGYLIERFPEKVHDDKRTFCESEIKSHLWQHEQLNESSKEFLRKLRQVEYIEDDKLKICVMHYPKDCDGKYMQHLKNPTFEECEKLFCRYDADIFLYGHTHQKNIVSDKQKMYINPGSLGCPAGTMFAYSGILEIDKNKPNYISINLQYDVLAVTKEIQKKNYPMCDKIIEWFFE